MEKPDSVQVLSLIPLGLFGMLTADVLQVVDRTGEKTTLCPAAQDHFFLYVFHTAVLKRSLIKSALLTHCSNKGYLCYLYWLLCLPGSW